MGKVINKGLGKLGEVGRSAGSIMTGANLRSSSATKSPPDQEAPEAAVPEAEQEPDEK